MNGAKQMCDRLKSSNSFDKYSYDGQLLCREQLMKFQDIFRVTHSSGIIFAIPTNFLFSYISIITTDQSESTHK